MLFSVYGLMERINTVQNFLVFATNFKKENLYIQEWLEYHLLVGVDHFYLYDQDGSNEAREILNPYEKAGVVTRHLWTHYDGTKFDGPTRFYQVNKNHLGFAHCASNYRDNTSWMMKIDIDEFLYPSGGDDSLLPYLHSLDRKRIKGVRIPRFNFGNNGHQTRPAGLVTEAYTYRESDYSNHKDMANCSFLSNNRFCNSAHRWHYRLLKPGKLITEEQAIGIRINHYYTKSFEEYQNRQNVSCGRGQDMDAFIARNKGCNEIEDIGMLQFTQIIKNNLNKRLGKL